MSEPPKYSSYEMDLIAAGLDPADYPIEQSLADGAEYLADLFVSFRAVLAPPIDPKHLPDLLANPPQPVAPPDPIAEMFWSVSLLCPEDWADYRR